VALLAARAPEAGPRAGGGAQGRRARVRGARRHPDPDRPGGRRPAVLLRQAPPPRHEPCKSSPARKERFCRCPGRSPTLSMTWPRRGSGASSRAGRRRVNRAGRQGLHRRRWARL